MLEDQKMFEDMSKMKDNVKNGVGPLFGENNFFLKLLC